MVKCSKAEVRRLRTALRWKLPAAQRERIQMVLIESDVLAYSPLHYPHIRRILARTSTESRVRLSPVVPSDTGVLMLSQLLLLGAGGGRCNALGGIATQAAQTGFSATITNLFL